MNHSILSAVLARANACPPINFREEFYAIKQHILERWGERCGTDYQRIVRACWGESYRLGCSDDCGRCGGTGIYSDTTYTLERWLYCGRVFHRPVGTIVGAVPTINGKIEHCRMENSRVCSAALFLLFAPHKLNIETRGGASNVDFARRAIRIAAAIGPVAKGDLIPGALLDPQIEVPF